MVFVGFQSGKTSEEHLKNHETLSNSLFNPVWANLYISIYQKEIKAAKEKVNTKVNQYKLDGVAPLMTDPPPTNFTSFSKKLKIYIDKNIIINDTRHVTCDT